MLFNSIDFAIFLPIVFILYWFVFNKNLRFQNTLIVVASYVFYGWWDWRFLFLIIFSTLVDFAVGVKLKDEINLTKRKILLWVSISINLGLLGFFKYYNFFLDNFVTAFSFFGKEIQANSLNIILPVGISFYTFQTLSYTFDVYKKKLEPTNDFISFSAFVSFFPQLVAGPIERATNLLPQFYTERNFDYSKAVDGLRQILWGLFKKVVIADNCARFANQIFNNSSELNGSSLVFGAVFFSIQIYGDFSGYSDIAIGTSRLFGFNLMRNFAFPYFSRDIAEFWRRWHISLTTWFRDYLYIPLGGSKGSTWMKIRNIFIVFLVSGFWHGSNWTFIAWGALNAIFFLPLILTKENRKYLDIVAEDRTWPTIKEFLQILGTFALTVFTWIFFRAENIPHALNYISTIFSPSLFSAPDFAQMTNMTKTLGMIEIMITFLFIFFFFLVEWNGRREQYAIAGLGLKWAKHLRWGFYGLVSIAILLFIGNKSAFIYFQF